MGMNPIALFATLPVPSDDAYTITLMHIHARTQGDVLDYHRKPGPLRG